jgi:hypothetical protein
MWNCRIACGFVTRYCFILAIFCLFAATLLPSTCTAEEPNQRVQGYLFAAPNIRTHEETITAASHFGGGADILLHKGLAAEAEIGYILPFQELVDRFGMLSFDMSHHMPRSKQLAVFALARYSVGLRDSSFEDGDKNTHLINFRVGATRWFGNGKGLRIELRDHLYTAETDITSVCAWHLPSAELLNELVCFESSGL